MFIAEVHPFIQSLEHIIGFLVVMAALLLLYALTAGVGTLLRSIADSRTGTAAPKNATVGTSPITTDDVTEEEIAALTACVSLIMGQQHRIVSIRPGDKSWSQEGRREHFASHRIR